ncbi:hypothetical protein AAC387_Pa07g3669 [Persea americana]
MRAVRRGERRPAQQFVGVGGGGGRDQARRDRDARSSSRAARGRDQARERECSSRAARERRADESLALVERERRQTGETEGRVETEMLPPLPLVKTNTVSLSTRSPSPQLMGVVTYTVMDDLVVKPMSTISGITLLNKFNVKDVGDLEESVVEVGMSEGLAILRASLESKTMLTDIFLGSGMKKA